MLWNASGLDDSATHKPKFIIQSAPNQLINAAKLSNSRRFRLRLEFRRASLFRSGRLGDSSFAVACVPIPAVA